MTRILPADAAAIRHAAGLLREGRLVAFPTETVYGLGADANSASAVRAIFAAKGRPVDHPLIVHIADAAQLCTWATDVSAVARQLAQAFWPGPLTLILRRGDRVSDVVTGGAQTVGLRCPAHPVAQQLLHEFGSAVAAPSANRFGRVSATCAAHVYEELGGRIDLILDGGPCSVGIESTIVDLTGAWPAILRPGGVSAQQLAEVVGTALLPTGAESPRVSGSMPSHYAPRAKLELVQASDLALRASALAGQGQRVAVLARAGEFVAAGAGVTHIILPPGDEELARVLYGALREIDAQGCDVALATLPAGDGLAAAIADRLRKAAGPRGDFGTPSDS